MARLLDIAGNPLIQDLPISYTAVATDLTRQKEVWFQKGFMLEAIRASIAVPGFFTPVIEEDRVLVDGGVLNPIPIIPTVAAHADLIIAVDLNADAQRHRIVVPETRYLDRSGFSDEWQVDSKYESKSHALKNSIKELAAHKSTGRIDVLFSSVEVMQESLGKYKVAGYPPDLLIGIPKDACRFYEFHRAREMIELGRIMAQDSLRQMERSMR